MDVSISISSRGFVVRRFQEQLRRHVPGLSVDGVFGPLTRDAVRDLQIRHGLQGTGQIGEAFCARLGLAWPSAFERCLNLSAEFEGTGFTRAVGPADTGDSAGVTFGLVGFTSFNGELQHLLRRYAAANAARYAEVVERGLGARAAEFRAAVESGDNKTLARFALDGGGRVIGSVSAVLRRLGQTAEMQALQVAEARQRYWALAEDQGRSLWGRPPLRALALLFDIAVQNGGLKITELEDCRVTFKTVGPGDGDRMWEVVRVLHRRLTNARRPKGIVDDVLARKRAIVSGYGLVHGREWWIRSFGV